MRVAIFLLISILVVHTQAKINPCSIAKTVSGEAVVLVGKCVKDNINSFPIGSKTADVIISQAKGAIEGAIASVCGKRRRAGFFSKVKNFAKKAAQKAKNLAKKAAQKAKNLAKKAAQKAKDLAKKAAQKAKDLAKKAAQKAKDLVKKAANKVKNVSKDVVKIAKNVSKDVVKIAKKVAVKAAPVIKKLAVAGCHVALPVVCKKLTDASSIAIKDKLKEYKFSPKASTCILGVVEGLMSNNCKKICRRRQLSVLKRRLEISSKK